MLTKMVHTLGALIFIVTLALGVKAQSAVAGPAQRGPGKSTRPFVLLSAQSLADLQRKLQPDNKVEDLIGGEGMQLRVAVQHEKDKAAAAAEVHDASDDVYYVLEGKATLTLGGTLDSPREVEAGEWRGPRIIGGQTVEVAKGDLIIVPRGTPHVRSTAGKDFTMILIKIFAEPMRAPQPAAVGKPQKP